MAYHRRMWHARNGVGSLGFRNQFLGLADPRPIGSLLILASQPLNRPPPAMDLRPDNPCDRIGPVLRAEGDVVRHVRALRRGDVAQAINTVGGGGGPPVFTDGRRSGPGIPSEVGQAFRGMWATHSDRSGPPIPRKRSCHSDMWATLGA